MRNVEDARKEEGEMFEDGELCIVQRNFALIL